MEIFLLALNIMANVEIEIEKAPTIVENKNDKMIQRVELEQLTILRLNHLFIIFFSLFGYIKLVKIKSEMNSYVVVDLRWALLILLICSLIVPVRSLYPWLAIFVKIQAYTEQMR
jgi:hypothetical protein